MHSFPQILIDAWLFLISVESPLAVADQTQPPANPQLTDGFSVTARVFVIPVVAELIATYCTVSDPESSEIRSSGYASESVDGTPNV
jgi:hypothetical protein